MEKKEFGFCQDVLLSVWKRQWFTVEAETREDAMEVAKRYGDEDVVYDFEVGCSEYLSESEDVVRPEKNGGWSTIEVYEGSTPMPSKLIADNHIEDFKPVNEDLLHETIADIAFNFGWKHHDEVDSREMVRCIVRWAKEFEELHRSTDWKTRGDYLTAIDEFSSDKIASYLLGKR